MEGRIEAVDRDFVRRYWEERWGLPIISTRGRYMPEDVQGITWRDEWGEALGLITWHIENDWAEIVSLDAFQQGRHIGGRLLSGAEEELRKRGVRHVMIVTTNDNLRAIAFYVRHGYRITRIELDGLDRVRAEKPDIPETGMDGIPLRDMFELEKDIQAAGGHSRMPPDPRPETFT